MLHTIPLYVGGSRHVRHFSASQVEWERYNKKLPVPTALYPCQEADSANRTDLSDVIGGVTLLNNIAMTSQAVINLYATVGRAVNDTLYGRYGVSFKGQASRVRASLATTLPPGTNSLSWFQRFRIKNGTSSVSEDTGARSGTCFGLRKKNIGANTNGWRGSCSNTTGYLSTVIDSAAAAETSTSLNIKHDEIIGASGVGAVYAWHDMMGTYNTTNGECNIYTDLGSVYGTHGHSGASLDNATYFFGMGDTQGNLNICAPCYISYGAYWVGHAFTRAQFDYLIGIGQL